MNKYSPLPAYVPLWAIGVGVGDFGGGRNRFRSVARLESRALNPSMLCAGSELAYMPLQPSDNRIPITVKFIETLKLAVRAIWAHKLRSR
jgi:hypothetical protein